MFVVRTKYYSAWKLTQADVVFCGLAYYPVKNKTPEVSDQKEIIEHRFDKLGNYRTREVEINLNPKIKIQVIL
jgi:hypothetical protein